MKEEEKKLLFLCRQERKYKKSCDVNSLTQLFFEKAFNLSPIQVLQCNKESCLQCAFILCSMCMDIHFTQLTLGQAGVSQCQNINTAACYLMSSGLFLFLFSVLSGRCVSMCKLSLPGYASLQAWRESDFIRDPAKGWCVTELSGILGCDISPPFQYMEGLQSFFGIKKNLELRNNGPN